MKIVLTLLVGLVPAAAQAAVYKCGEGGQVVFTDRPCVYAPPADKAAPRPTTAPARPAEFASRLQAGSREASAPSAPAR